MENPAGSWETEDVFSSLSNQAFQAGSEIGDLQLFELHSIYQDASKKNQKTLLLWSQNLYKTLVSPTERFFLIKQSVPVNNDKPTS